MKRLGSKGRGNDGFYGEIDWELRPGGMIVQKRNNIASSSSSAHLIRVKVSHGSFHHNIMLHPQSTFGELKRILWEKTGLEPKDQRLLFRGKEKENEERLHMVGVNDMSKVILMEDPASTERKLEQMKKNRNSSSEALSEIRTQVDKLSEKVLNLERFVSIGGGKRVEEKEVNMLTELLMMQLLKLDAIEIDGDVKLQRRTEVIRVQNFVDRLDNLKVRSRSTKDAFSMRNTKWETFESGIGSLNAPTSKHFSTKITHDWEMFD